VSRTILAITGLAMISTVAACAPSDTSCAAPKASVPRTVKSLTADERDQAREDHDEAVKETTASPSPLTRTIAGMNAARDPYENYVGEINRYANDDYCLRAKAYAARGVDDHMETVAKAVLIQCSQPVTEDTTDSTTRNALSYVLQYRACATSHRFP